MLTVFTKVTGEINPITDESVAHKVAYLLLTCVVVYQCIGFPDR